MNSTRIEFYIAELEDAEDISDVQFILMCMKLELHDQNPRIVTNHQGMK